MGVRTAVLIVLLFAIAAPARAQGAFVARSAHGFLLGGEMEPENGRTSYVLVTGFSYRGTLDLGLAYHWVETAADTLDPTLTGKSLEPRAALHLIKQGARYPFSISAHGAYGFSMLDPDGLVYEVNGRRLSAGGTIHSIVQVARSMGLRPWAGIFYVHQRREYEFGDGSTVRFEWDDTQYSAGLHLVFVPTTRSVFFAGPAIRRERGESRVGISGGIVFN